MEYAEGLDLDKKIIFQMITGPFEEKKLLNGF